MGDRGRVKSVMLCLQIFGSGGEGAAYLKKNGGEGAAYLKKRYAVSADLRGWRWRCSLLASRMPCRGGGLEQGPAEERWTHSNDSVSFTVQPHAEQGRWSRAGVCWRKVKKIKIKLRRQWKPLPCWRWTSKQWLSSVYSEREGKNRKLYVHWSDLRWFEHGKRYCWGNTHN